MYALYSTVIISVSQYVKISALMALLQLLDLVFWLLFGLVLYYILISVEFISNNRLDSTSFSGVKSKSLKIPFPLDEPLNLCPSVNDV